ncbi:MAG: urea carboxylase, partial [Rhodospirillaceae bacterium]|nr:urea carboxylase [Rhodospirillaceae bacterium]
MAEPRPLRRVLVANRGEIACRIIRTLHRMGMAAVAVYSEADAGAPHVRMAEAAVQIGPAPAAESYLRGERIIDAAHGQDADAIHPGYGFLSEDPDFASAVEGSGLAFCGPTPEQIRTFGRKDAARALARTAGLPLLPGSGPLAGPEAALREAGRIGYPIMLKSTAGGGGIGMAVCPAPEALADAYARTARLSRASFGSGDLYLERHVARARHVEVQVFGDGAGGAVALGDRDCSLQRRNQKVLEEAPAPGIDEGLRHRLVEGALALVRSVDYRSAGTVEFLLDALTGEAFFLEVNARLQVEHPVTEAVLGIDLVEWMVRLAAGEPVLQRWCPRPPAGHAIEARIYAEDPVRDFRPSSGRLTQVAFPAEVRVDAWAEAGAEVTPHYDALLAKLVVHGDDRPEALERLRRALEATEIHGVETNLPLLRAAARAGPFAEGRPTTDALEGLPLNWPTIEVLAPGLVTTLQDHPGRLGYWSVGVPPSGPMDTVSFRLANRLVGNPEGAVALELTRLGPTLRFACAADVCLTGARMAADLDGDPVAWWRPVPVGAGQTLRLGAVEGAGARAYLAVRGGLLAPQYLGSRATFTLGGIGGHGGRALRAGDVLRVGAAPARRPSEALPAALVPPIGSAWELGALYGPHAAPDFFTADYMEAFLTAAWTVHHNSDRTGVRLIGPRPGWARADGGEAGLHPSNIHDCAYAVGAVDFTGDMPVILGPDGPSLGGFVCPVTVAGHELWKLGQLSPGDTVRFRLLDPAAARRGRVRQDREVATLQAERGLPAPARRAPAHQAVIARLPGTGARPAVVYRRSGDANVLVEYGPEVLDLTLRLRVHALMRWLEERRHPGVIELTPGIRSLQVHVDERRLTPEAAVEALLAAEDELPAADEIEVPSRVV